MSSWYCWKLEWQMSLFRVHKHCIALESMLVDCVASESAAGFYVAVEGLQAGSVFTKVFHMLCVFTVGVESTAGVASESPSVLYAIRWMSKKCWPCPLNQFQYDLKQYCFHTLWQKQPPACADITFLTLPGFYGGV